MWRFGVGLFLGIMMLSARAELQLQGAPAELTQYLLNDKKVMTVSADGEVRVQADKAVVTLRVKNKDGNFGVALQANRALRDKLRQRLVEAKIPAESIAFARYSSVPSYGLFGEKPSSYEISNEVTVAVHGEDEFIAVAQAIDAMKEVAYVGIDFQDTQKKKNEVQALENALQDVRSKQALYEKTFGVTLGMLRVLDGPVVFTAPRMRYPVRAMAKMDSTSSAVQSAPMELSLESESDADSGGAFGTLVYRASASVEYQVTK